MPSKMSKINTEAIMKVLRRYADRKKLIYFEEIRCGSGKAKDSRRRMDAYTIEPFPSKGNKTVAYEVKASRSDFTQELKKVAKQRPARLFSNEFYYVAPKGMIKIEEVPVWAGLMEVSETRALRTVVTAPFMERSGPSWRFVISLIRHVYRHKGTDRFRYTSYEG